MTFVYYIIICIVEYVESDIYMTYMRVHIHTHTHTHTHSHTHTCRQDKIDIMSNRKKLCFRR